MYDEACNNINGKAVIRGNIVLVENLLAQVKSKRSFKEIIKGAFGKEMTFDIVIGNPPYNNDLYLDFVTQGHKAAKQCSIWITPAKWQNSSNKANKKFRQEIAQYISNVVFYPDCYDLFAISLACGITYFVVRKDIVSEQTVENRCIAHPEFNSSIQRGIYNSTLLNFGDQIIKKINSNNSIVPFNNLRDTYYVAISKQITVSGGGFATREKDNEGHWHVRPDVVGNASMLFSKSENNIVVIGNPYIDKHTDIDIGVKELGIFSSDSKSECISFMSYIETKFVKTLLFSAISSLTCMGDAYTWRFVPDPANWNLLYEDKPLPNYTPDPETGEYDAIHNDKDNNPVTIRHCSLYVKYHLTEDEINIIESVIKARK